MNEFNRHDLEAVLRNDLASFIQRSFQTIVPAAEYQDNWHIDAIAWHLQQCLDGQIKRLIITLPPRNLKSICASVAFPAFVLGHDPTRRIICELRQRADRQARPRLPQGDGESLVPIGLSRHPSQSEKVGRTRF